MGTEFIINYFIFWLNCFVYLVEYKTSNIFFSLISTTMSLQILINKYECLLDDPKNFNLLLCTATDLLQDLDFWEMSKFVLHGLVQETAC